MAAKVNKCLGKVRKAPLVIDKDRMDTFSLQQSVEVASSTCDANVVALSYLCACQVDSSMDMAVQALSVIENM
ncbi:hypothetical protein RGCCGE502_20180 [Rhizobium grahamii CCGE 502]|uniref:Uncharacterized protein n=1 Tax=Rhizobium grahamii CCGE 502 TaxID=990285 RepID=S3HCP5_9HYPH|nr:hypothetical protein RGCCGE502_20180 [Rhizobium grahamii CCGE 502]